MKIHNIKVEDKTPVVLVGERNSLTTMKAYRENGITPNELEELGYVIPLGSGPEAYLVEEFRFGWVSVDSYGKTSYRKSKSLAGIKAAVEEQMGALHPDTGWVTNDGIARMTTFECKAGTLWRHLPLRAALYTKEELTARWEEVLVERAGLQGAVDALTEEAKSLILRLDAMA